MPGTSCATAGGVVTCTVGTLPSGGFLQYDVVAEVLTPTTSGPVTNSASVTGTVPDPDTANNSASQSTTVAACSPRPDVKVAAVATNDGRLRVIVTASTSPLLPNNVLTSITFDDATNALIDFPNRPPGAPGGFTVPLAPADSPLVFHVRRQTPGQPTRVPFTVVDSCAGWKTFVGGGVNAEF